MPPSHHRKHIGRNANPAQSTGRTAISLAHSDKDAPLHVENDGKYANADQLPMIVAPTCNLWVCDQPCSGIAQLEAWKGAERRHAESIVHDAQKRKRKRKPANDHKVAYVEPRTDEPYASIAHQSRRYSLTSSVVSHMNPIETPKMSRRLTSLDHDHAIPALITLMPNGITGKSSCSPSECVYLPDRCISDHHRQLSAEVWGACFHVPPGRMQDGVTKSTSKLTISIE